MARRQISPLLALSLLVFTQCGDASTTSSSASAVKDAGSAKPASSAKPTSSAGTSDKPAAPSAAASSAPAAGEELKGEAFLKLLKLPDGSKAQAVPGMEGFGFLAPADTKLANVDADRPKKWGTTTFGGMTMATLLVNHEQDEGEKCMKLAEAKAKVGSAKIVKEQTFTVPVEEKAGKYTDYGDEAAELLVFEREGKQGFYVHKVFDHGDDATRICCTAGAAADAKELKGTADASQIEAMSAVCLSWSFRF